MVVVGQCWRNKKYPLREQAISLAAPEFCLSAPSFELGLDWIFSFWTEENIEELYLFNNSCPANVSTKDFPYAIQILAGTTPAMIAQGFLQGALLNINQCIKLPRQQTTFAYLLHQSFKENAQELAALFSLDNGQDLPLFYEKLKAAELVIAYGHDETLSTIKKYISPNTIFIAHGHAESAAVIFKEAANSQSLEKLAYDMLSYDQRGCLSPRVTFIQKGGELTPEKCAEYFAKSILPKLSEKLPRGGLFEGEAAEILHQRSLYTFRGKVYSGQDWTVCYDENLIWPKESLPRFMPFKSFNTLDELKSLLPSLISIGYAGSSEKEHNLKHIASRLCYLGEMQKQCLVF